MPETSDGPLHEGRLPAHTEHRLLPEPRPQHAADGTGCGVARSWVPPQFAGSWQSENKAFINASYELDLWGKNREALKSAVSGVHASEAEAEQVKLTLSTAIARAYNELARLYTLLAIAQDEVKQ